MGAFTFTVAVLTAVSAGFIVADEYIFRWLRDIAVRIGFEPLTTFVHCPVCLSWWFGLGAGLLVYGLSWWAVGSAFVSSLVARAVQLLEG